MHSHRLSLLGALLVALLASHSSWAEGPKAAPALQESVELNLVNLDVVVTDRGGHRVSDLGQADFEVRENGKPVAITNFSRLGGLAASTAGVAPESSPAPALEPLQVVILVDNSSISPVSREAVLEQLRPLLAEKLKPQDRVMVASFGHAIRVHQPLTTDRKAVLAALDQVSKTPSLARETEEELDNFLESLDNYLEGESVEGCKNIIEPAVARYTSAVTQRVRGSLNATADLLRTLAAVPGKKQLLLVSDGLELRPGSYLISLLASLPSCPDPAASLRGQGTSIAFAMKAMGAVANAARVTIYPLDAGGARGSASGGNTTAQSSNAGRRPQVAAEQRSALQDSLTFLASETGGKAFLNVVEVAPVWQQMASDEDGSYSLAYESPRHYLGEHRWLEVKVKRRGLDVRYRRSWRDESVEDRMKQQLLAALWLGDTHNPLGVRLEPAGQVQTSEEGPLVPLRLGVPLQNLVLSTTANGHEGRLRVFVTSATADGESTNFTTSEVPIVIPEDRWAAAQAQLWGYDIRLLARQGTQTVAVGIEDIGAATTSVVTREVRVGSP
ncbi:MAG TPA: VWA domain-containing protein [Thermoanaerobaculia bacterium]|nr:VWA domain-containing protein [Thermoanaerobaculia bacterium]